MSQTMQSMKSFMGGADYIAPDTDLDAYMENLIKTKNTNYRRKLEKEQAVFVAKMKAE